MSLRNVIDTIAAKIPGYSGYAEAEKRRAEDRELRAVLAERLGELKAHLNEQMRQLQSAGQYDMLSIADRFAKEVDLAQQKTLHAFEGYSGLFADRRIDSKQLEEVVDLDESLISLVDQLTGELRSRDLSAETLSAAAEDLRLYHERFDSRVALLKQG